ncbi:MAG TPA: gamma-glutamyl-gamma-aminobutyrate hydrolase family protein [Candidatus Acidoferrales bacterium]|nr:gamma-glutamyl-gamma-aminobutyrate hydrolase family protein [Candidatus Acidoferrales bacterium]
MPLVGVPYRTVDEEVKGSRERYDWYIEAIRRAGGEPKEIPLTLPKEKLSAMAKALDAFVLPGSPADVNPNLYRESLRPKCAPADAGRESTDLALLRHAFDQHKPVLAICYGIQILNVFLGGSLIQDIPSECRTAIVHSWDRKHGAPEPFHPIRIEPNSRIEQLTGSPETTVNSSHHQAIFEPGRGLRVTARAADGIIEAVEWTGSSDWVTGVQWHPERMPGHELSAALFRELVGVARGAQVRG